MDLGEEDAELIHSKFRKAQRKVVSRLTTDNQCVPTVGGDQQQQQRQHSPTYAHPHHHPTTLTRGLSFEEHMHVESVLAKASPGFASTPNRLDTGVIRISALPKSPIFGTNISFSGATTSQPHTPTLHGSLVSSSGGRPTHPHMTSGGTSASSSSSSFPCEVFRFDSTDRERYLCSAISEEEEVFSPGPSPSSLSSYDSPQVVLDSPRITISPLRIQDSPPSYLPPSAALTPSPKMDSQNRLMARVHPSLTMLPPPSASIEQSRCLFGVPSSPVSPLTPNTPLSPSPLFNVDQSFQQGFLAELYRRRYSALHI